MPRIQILALPEGTADERPPFLLVIDQAPYDGALATQLRDEASVNIDLAERTGARGVLLFEDTVDIPANGCTSQAITDQMERERRSYLADQLHEHAEADRSNFTCLDTVQQVKDWLRGDA